MPQREVFFEQAAGDRRIQVLKTYDPAYAREVFDEMGEQARSILWSSLEIEQTYDPADLPGLTDPDRADFLWHELMDSAKEDVRVNPNQRSFFAVNEIRKAPPQSLVVCADWPSAENFAKRLQTDGKERPLAPTMKGSSARLARKSQGLFSVSRKRLRNG